MRRGHLPNREVIAASAEYVRALLADRKFVEIAEAAVARGRIYTPSVLWFVPRCVAAVVVPIVAVRVRLRDGRRRFTAALADRLQAPTRRAVREAYDECGYRQCRQGHEVVVVLGQGVWLRSDVALGGAYSARCSYRKRVSRHELAVPYAWRKRVAAFGAATYNGRLILNATPTPAGWVLQVATQRSGTGLGAHDVLVPYSAANASQSTTARGVAGV